MTVAATISEAAAVHIMGWGRRRVPWAYEGQADVWHDAEGLPVLTCCSWRPETDDAQALEVLDRMSSRGFEYFLTSNAGRVNARFTAGGEALGQADAPDRRGAILRAALRAVGEPFPA